MSKIDTLISDALIDLGKLSPSETIEVADLTHGVRVANRLFGRWATQNLLIPYTTSETFSMTAGTYTYTMGSGGTASSTRALRLVDNCYITDSAGLSYPTRLIDQGEYNRIYDKDLATIPEAIFYDPLYPTSYLYYYPSPASAYTAYIESIKNLHSSFSIGDSLSLSVEYEDFVVLSLRNRLAGSFGIPVTQDMRAEAYQAEQDIKLLNFANRSETMEMPAMFGGRARLGTIESG